MIQRQISGFDAQGVSCVILFAYFMTQQLMGSAGTNEEIAIAITPEDLESGFREGVEWHGIYLREAKVGFSKLERRVVAEGYLLTHLMRLNMTVMRQNQTLTTTVETLKQTLYVKAL